MQRIRAARQAGHEEPLQKAVGQVDERGRNSSPGSPASEVHDVRNSEVRRTVLIVDEDFGFVCWLGELLAEVGYDVIPASDTRSALALIDELNLRVNLLIVNPKIRGAFKMTRLMSSIHDGLKIVAIGNPGMVAGEAIPAQTTMERPGSSESLSRQECLSSIRKVLKNAQIAA